MDIPSKMISLSKNEIKLIRQLKLKKFRHKYKKFICEGFKMCSEVLLKYPDLVDFVCFDEKEGGFYLDKLRTKDTSKLRTSSSKELEKVSSLDTFDGILAVCHFPEPNKQQGDFHFFLEKIHDPGNLGTIMRTADWYGSNRIYLSEGCVDPYNAKTVQASMGSVFRVSCVVKTIAELRERFELIGTAMNGSEEWNYDSTKKPLLVLGSESNGMSKNTIEQCHKVWSISPSKNLGAESLNVSIAAGIFAHHLAAKGL